MVSTSDPNLFNADWRLLGSSWCWPLFGLTLHQPSKYSGCRPIGLGSHYGRLNAEYPSSHHSLIDRLRAVDARDWMGGWDIEVHLAIVVLCGDHRRDWLVGLDGTGGSLTWGFKLLLGRPRTFKNYHRTLEELVDLLCGNIGKNHVVVRPWPCRGVFGFKTFSTGFKYLQVTSSCVGPIINWLGTGTVLDSSESTALKFAVQTQRTGRLAAGTIVEIQLRGTVKPH
ncbi:hypothetical protein C8R46DRAFT_1223717 [Mycena filopes]|nr:hypothetical protein C8R46DRAFT_1223717 [Mycena filopes]